MGIDPKLRVFLARKRRWPHTHGDRPRCSLIYGMRSMVAPYTWG